MILELEEAKLYLRVEGDEEDTLITNFILSAEEICEGILRYPLSELQNIPTTINLAILYIVSNMYETREDFDIGNVLDVTKRLLFLYRKEKW
ncbi:head-tail connector protein [Tissierella creatinophila]|uniref:Phage gp6-like head-tail connector protein n=1 Tax=Tissierella creatinophila DSM 6911 TaxID=1123403 RepID=A0A1U7M5H0_TISCR|nr:head-tail connector protein [Tissierella creatinophila]OLS02557.1 phage gp6-like head-tail connector protein [Tissierella creatinophila DSM 6911]